MKKQTYISPAIHIIDMRSYDIMEIQGESKFSVDGQDPVQNIEGDPEFIDAKQYKIDIWADDEPSEDEF